MNAPTATRDAGYLPHLDGLRAVAVYLVVAYHAGARPAAGGFIGVDVFFVLSGCLITGMLLDEWERRQRIDLWRFYARRVRRLLPAAALAAVGAAVLFAYTESPLRREAVVGDGRAGSWFYANWHFLHQAQDYFAASVDQSPFVHMWSLAVEEQFYLVWPVLLWGLLAFTGRLQRPRRALGVVIAALGVASAWEALAIARVDTLRAYYGTDTRAFQLLLGAGVALVVRSWPRLGARVHHLLGDAIVAAASVVVLVLATNRVQMAPVTRGAATAVATAVVLLGLQALPSPGTRRVLGLRPLALLGSLSYATYLWHWPLILAMRHLVVLDGTELAVLTSVLATAVAALSAELLEWPIRRSARLDRRPRISVAAGLALAGLMGAVVVPGILRSNIRPVAGRTDQSTQRITVTLEPPVASRTPVPPDLDIATVNQPVPGLSATCFVTEPRAADARCTMVQGPGPSVLLVGDSHARRFTEVLRQLAVEHGWTFTTAVSSACPWQQGLLMREAPQAEAERQLCLAHQDQAVGTLLDLVRPDVVIAVGRSLHPVWVSATTREPGLSGEGSDVIFETLSRRTIARYGEVAAHVVVLAPLPISPVDIPSCLSAATFLEECAFVADTPYAEEVFYRRLAAEDPMVSVLDLSRLICPDFPVCLPVVDGHITRTDMDHPSATFLSAARAEILRRLVELGVVPAS